MAEADNARDKISNFIVTGIERDSLRVDNFIKDEDADLSEVVVTDSSSLLGAVKIQEVFAWYNFQAKEPGKVAYNLAGGEAAELEGGYAGMLDILKEKFEAVYPEEGNYKFWGNANDWVARGIIQECITLY